MGHRRVYFQVRTGGGRLPFLGGSIKEFLRGAKPGKYAEFRAENKNL